MASAIIHICVAKEIGKKTNKESKDYYLGSIAPDISKHLGQTKEKTHFQTNSVKDSVPVLSDFLSLYKDDITSDFTLGYFIHLYTDKLWFDGFIDKLVLNENIRLIDGTILKTTPDEITRLIYNDYTNMNISLIDKYELDLSLFYEDFVVPKSKIKEVPLEQMNLLIDKMGIIIENSKKEKEFIFDVSMVNNFIVECSNEIYNYLLDNKLI